jgi:3-oxoacyl-[acyl-carrier protein] reductase
MRHRRVVFVTGAAGGLGSSLVAEFLRQGWLVAAAWHQRPIEVQHSDLLTIPIDVRNSTSCTGAAQTILHQWRRIDVLVNVAGVLHDDLILRLSEKNWDAVLDTNLKGAWNCTRAVLPAMLEQSDGHLLFLGSFSGRVGNSGQSNYAAAKAGLAGLTSSLATELGPSNVRANLVLPGVLETPMLGNLTEEQRAAFARSNTLGRLNDTAEVASFIAHLAGMRNVSGQVFQLDSRLASWS